MPTIDPTTRTIVIDNSFLETFTSCPFKAYAKYILRRSAPPGPAIRFGSIIHKTLSYRYKMMGFSKPWTEQKQIQILQKAFNSNPIEIEDWRNLASAVKVIQVYNRRYDDETFVVAKNSNWYNLPLVEHPFELFAGRVHGWSVHYIGRIDMLIKDGPNFYILDHKTTSIGGQTFWDSFDTSEQMKGYCWVIKQVLGIEPTGFIINAIICRESIQNSEYDDVLGCLRPLSKGSKAIPLELERRTFYTAEPKNQLTEWHRNMLGQVDEFLYLYERNKLDSERWEFSRHHQSCIGKYGRCELFSCCSLPTPEQRQSHLQSDLFIENNWSPLYH